MVSLKNQILSRRAPLDKVWAVAAMAVYGIPLALLLARALETPLSNSLSVNFFRLLLKALGYNFAQAILSAFTCVGLAAVGAFCLAYSPGLSRLKKLISRSGEWIFSLPGLMVAVLFVQLGAEVWFVPNQGTTAIVLAHLWINIFFATSQLFRRLESDYRTHGAERLSVAANLGAGWLEKLKIVFFSARSELISLFVMVFFLSWMAFATLLVLGSPQGEFNLEVLLFYFIQNGFDEWKVLILIALQVLVTGLLLKVADKKSPTATSSEAFREGETVPVGVFPVQKLKIGAWIYSLIFFSPILFLLKKWVGVVVNFESIEAEWWESALRTVGLSLLAVVVAGLLFWAVLNLSQTLRKCNFYLMGVSTTVLLGLWVGAINHFGSRLGLVASYVAVAVGINLALLPLFSLLISSRLEALSEESIGSALLLGCSPRKIKRYLFVPICLDLRKRWLVMSALLSIGEISLSSFFLFENPPLSVLSRQMMSHYDFRGSAFVLALMLVYVVVIFGLERLAPQKTSLS